MELINPKKERTSNLRHPRVGKEVAELTKRHPSSGEVQREEI